MAWCRTGDKSLSEPTMTYSPTIILSDDDLIFSDAFSWNKAFFILNQISLKFVSVAFGFSCISHNILDMDKMEIIYNYEMTTL